GALPPPPAPSGMEPLHRPRGKTVRIFPYAVSRAKLDRAIRKFRVPAYIVEDPDEADLVLTLKSQERRQPRKLRDVEAKGVPLHVGKSNTVTQMENFLRGAFSVGDYLAGDEAALREVEDGIEEVLEQGHPVELSPQSNYLRRLQHQFVESQGLTS